MLNSKLVHSLFSISPIAGPPSCICCTRSPTCTARSNSTRPSLRASARWKTSVRGRGKDKLQWDPSHDSIYKKGIRYERWMKGNALLRISQSGTVTLSEVWPAGLYHRGDVLTSSRLVSADLHWSTDWADGSTLASKPPAPPVGCGRWVDVW